MLYDPNKSFGYPVLSPLTSDGSADYIGVAFQASISPEVVKSGEEIKICINYVLHTSLVALKDKISDGSAAYFLHIVCPATHFSELLEIEPSGSGEWKISAERLREEVFVSSFILSKKDIEIRSDKINDEFGFKQFSVPSGSVLALCTPESFYVEKDTFRPIVSLFRWVEKEGLEEGKFTVNLTKDYVCVEVNPKQAERLRQIIGKGGSGKSAFLSSVALSTILHMLVELRGENAADYEDKKWAKVLKTKYPDWGTEQPLVLAQNILKQPIKNLHKIWGN